MRSYIRKQKFKFKGVPVLLLYKILLYQYHRKFQLELNKSIFNKDSGKDILCI